MRICKEGEEDTVHGAWENFIAQRVWEHLRRARRAPEQSSCLRVLLCIFEGSVVTAKSLLVCETRNMVQGPQGTSLQLTQWLHPAPGQGQAPEIRKPFLVCREGCTGSLGHSAVRQLEDNLGPERCQPGRWGRSWPGTAASDSYTWAGRTAASAETL